VSRWFIDSATDRTIAALQSYEVIAREGFMKKTAKVAAKGADKPKPKAKVAVAKAPAKAPVSAAKAKVPAPTPAPKVGWSETIRNAMKGKPSQGPQAGNVWTGKRRAGSPALKNGTKTSNSG
jgi:hypothetical protein